MNRFASARILSVSAITSVLLTLIAAASVLAGGGNGPLPI